MPTKKGKGAEPTRRSARIASQEPSVASDTSETVKKPVLEKLKGPVLKLQNRYEATTWDVDSAIREIRCCARQFGQHDIQKYINKLTEAQREAVIIGFAQQSNDLEDSVEELKGDVEDAERERDDARANRPPSIRRHFTLQNVRGNYTRKEQKSAETQTEEKETQEPAATAPSPPERPAEVATPVRRLAPPPVEEEKERLAVQTPSSIRRIFSSLGGYIPTFRKRAAEDEPAAPPAEKRSRIDEPERATPAPEPRGGHLKRAAVEEPAAPPSEKRLRIDEPETVTPNKRRSPMHRPSASNPRVPTSLSTITEYTEPSELSIPDTTPSKPSRGLPQSTLSISQISSPMPPSVPHSTPTNGLLLRRATLVRAARKAEQTPTFTPYSWERNAAKPRPREPNADVRQAKIQRMRQLQKELEELKQDADIKDMTAQSARSRKRVKIDNLAAIPHNRPGDSSSTFRVPDIDSDDEMEVDANVEERSNIFEDVEMEKETEKEAAIEAEKDTVKEVEHIQVPVFEFPDVGAKPADYVVTEDYQNEAGLWFEKGLHGFIPA